MLNYLDESDPHCSTKADLESFYEVCRFLNIPYEILDFREEYETKVLHYIYESYLKGITPNPDVLCNTEVKFKLFLDEALRMGYDMIAMGHYAQIQLPVTSYQLPVMTMDQTLRNRKQVAGNRKLLR
jgi:tRNA-specific 2-thiouridylase